MLKRILLVESLLLSKVALILKNLSEATEHLQCIDTI